MCSLEKRLQRAGLVAKRVEGEQPERAGFSVKPLTYTVGRDSRLELFFYASERALQKDLAKMDTIRAAPLGSAGSWTMPPTFIHSANLAGVLLTPDAREADRLSLAITAGPPQSAR